MDKCKYFVNTKWISEDEGAVDRWRQLTSSSTNPRSSNANDGSSVSSRSYAETLWGNIGASLEESVRPSEDNPTGTPSASLDAATTNLVVQSRDRISSAGDRTTFGSSTLSDSYASTTVTQRNPHPWFSLLEMLSIRVIILAKVHTGIIRRQIDFEAPSNRDVGSLYTLLEKELPTLQKIQIYYTNTRINHRTDLTKLPAGDQRMFGDLAGNKGTIIFVVATAGVRVF